jgi:hypothetical protein
MSNIINENKIEKQVNIESIENIEKVNELHIHQKESKEKLADDSTSSDTWYELSKPEDMRNLRDKFLAVCTDYSSPKLNKYNRNLVEGKSEQSNYDDRDISSLKFIIFDKCQDRLIGFYEENQNKQRLNRNEVEEFINLYIMDAKQIIEDKQQVYNYPNVTDDFIKKLVLDLIDECFLSFDEKGIYDD